MTAGRVARLDAVRAILTENARLLGEPQDAFLRVMPFGAFRVQIKRRGRWGDYNDYSNLDALERAAVLAAQTAEATSAFLAKGVPMREAVWAARKEHHR